MGGGVYYWISILVVWNILWFIVYHFYNVEFSWRTLAAPLLLYVIMHVIDTHSTYLCITSGGTGSEENRSITFLAYFFNAELIRIVIASKVIILFVLLPLLLSFFKFRYAYATLLSSNLMFVFVVSGNYYAYYKMVFP